MQESRETQRAEHAVDPAAICTLDRPELSDRLAFIRRQLQPHVIASQRLTDGRSFTFAAAPGLAERVDVLIAAERACCAPIRWERVAGATPGEFQLEVRGVDPNASVFEHWIPSERRSWPRMARLFKAAGAGLSLAFFVCCVLPALAIALLGAGVAPFLSYFATLEQPWVIGLGAIASSGALWWWLERTSRRGCFPDGHL